MAERRRGRPSCLPPDAGPRVAEERAAGTPWKVLERRYGVGRTRLWQLARAAKSELVNTFGVDREQRVIQG